VFNSHLSDDEQAEALKRWWSENGKSVIGGIVLGLVLVFGWRGWGDHQRQQAELASAEYDRLLVSLQKGEIDAATKQAERIAGEYSGTAYDYFASLDMAKKLIESNDLTGAKLQLEFAVANADNEGLKQLAQARLARVLLAMNDTAGAQAVISSQENAEFSGEFAHVQGDIELANDNLQGAKAAYQKALDNNASNRRLIEMKLNDI